MEQMSETATPFEMEQMSAMAMLASVTATLLASVTATLLELMTVALLTSAKVRET